MSLNNHENFLSRNVNRCPCLMHILSLIYDADICSLLLILEIISKSGMDSTQVYCLRVEEKTSCTIMCQSHLLLTLFSETKYECTLQSNTDFLLQLYKDAIENLA